MSDKYEDDSAIIDGLRETLAEVREENRGLRATLKRTEEALKEERKRHRRLFEAKKICDRNWEADLLRGRKEKR